MHLGICNLLPHIVGPGQLHRNTTFVSDHPAIYIQVIADILLLTSTKNIPKSPGRLCTNVKAKPEQYLEELRVKHSKQSKNTSQRTTLANTALRRQNGS